MARIKLKNLRKVWGEFDFASGDITIHSQLQNLPRPSKSAVKYHEEMHKWLAEQGIDKLDDSIELKCEVYSLMKCKKTELTYLERYLKKQIIKRHGILSKKRILEIKEFL